MNNTGIKQTYLDNGATSFPKPETVALAVNDYITNVGASINRSVYEQAQNAEMVTYTLRERLSDFFDHGQPRNVVLTPGNTWGLNMVIKGSLKPGDHVIVSAMEHNAVMRPLVQLSEGGVEFERVPCDDRGFLDPADLEKLIRPNTRMVIVCHASNVSGSIQDIYAIGEICHKYGVDFVLDGAQTAGHFPIDFAKAHLSALSVPGHKGLMGPQGIGALLLSSDIAKRIDPLVAGGTGSASDSEEIPDYMPDKFESGTMNLPGIYGFEAAMEYIERIGIEELMKHDRLLSGLFISSIKKLQNKYGDNSLKLVGSDKVENRVGVISLDFPGKDNAEVSYRLESEFGILTRCGMHCAPSAHKTLNTFPQGVVRFSHGWFNTEEDILTAVEAIDIILS